MKFWDRISEIDRDLDSTTYYELLGVPASADDNEISDQYYELVARLHPDRFVTRSSSVNLAALTRINARMAEAKTVLLNRERRAEYDEGLTKGETRIQNTAPKARKLKQDPESPMAQRLLDDALIATKCGDTAQARAKLTLARQFEPESKTIAYALKLLDNDPEDTGSSVATTVPEPPALKPDAPEAQESALPVAKVAERQQVRATPSPRATTELGRHTEGQAPKRLPTAPPPIPSAERKHPRHSAVVPVRLRISSWAKFQVLYSRDISSGGMFLKSSKAIPVGTRLRLDLIAPNGESIAIRAHVVRFRPEGKGQPAGMGLRFDELDDHTKQKVQMLLQHTENTAKSAKLDVLVAELLRIRDLPPHQVLGVAANAGKEDRKLGYQACIQRFHPHHNGLGKDPALLEVCRDLIACVQSAYESTD